MITRRAALATLAAVAATPTCAPAAPGPFATRDGAALKLGGRPYRFAGTNVWYAVWLGADSEHGDRARLSRELDALAGAGVTNLRIAASAELSPLRNSVRPAFRDGTPNYNETLLVGLDHTLAEMARRDITAVLYLTNFWKWSGGKMTYLSWVHGGRYINMNDPAHRWPAFADFNADFYRSAEAVGSAIPATATSTTPRFRPSCARASTAMSTPPCLRTFARAGRWSARTSGRGTAKAGRATPSSLQGGRRRLAGRSAARTAGRYGVFDTDAPFAPTCAPMRRRWRRSEQGGRGLGPGSTQRWITRP